MRYPIIAVWILSIVSAEEDAVYWRKMANADLEKLLRLRNNHNVAKNVILFIGDGMGVSTVTAARIFKGQLKNKTGEEEKLAFENFPHISLVKTYSVDFQTTDSAASANAFLAGVKTNSEVLGYDSRVKHNNCSTISESSKLGSILHWSIAEGKSTGVVSTTRITHATPAAAYAFTANREWEGDRSILNNPNAIGCKDIAYQLINDNPDIRVILGGGRRYFLPADAIDPGNGQFNLGHGRVDGLNLIEEWEKEKNSRNARHEYVWNKQQLDQVDTENTDYLLGLFSSSHMEYEINRNNQEPSIAEMTKKSIEILQKNNKGYFLYVEGGRIDHAHHSTMAKRAFVETLAFEEAVEVAMNMTSPSDTLIVVTADHSHVMVISGYSSRGNPILGVMDTDVREATDGLNYTTLLYGNGPGFSMANGIRENISEIDTTSDIYMQQTAVPLTSETHSGEDVAVYARGPMSHLFTGVMEQNFIATAMAYASCVGENKIYNQIVGDDKVFPH